MLIRLVNRLKFDSLLDQYSTLILKPAKSTGREQGGRLRGDFDAEFAPQLAYCETEDIHPALK